MASDPAGLAVIPIDRVTPPKYPRRRYYTPVPARLMVPVAHGGGRGKNIRVAYCVIGDDITNGHMNVLSYCVAAGLCRETQDEEVAAEQVAQEV